MLVVKGTKEWKERGVLFFYWMGETEVAFYIFRELQRTFGEHPLCVRHSIVYFILFIFLLGFSLQSGMYFIFKYSEQS